MNKEEVQDLLAAVLRRVDFATNKKPNEGEKSQAEADLSLIRENYAAVNDLISGKDVRKINESFRATPLSYYEGILADAGTQPPSLPRDITDAYLSENALPGVYDAHTTVYGVLETLEPILAHWESAYTRAKEVHRLVFLSDTQWQADAAFHLAFDQDAYARIVELRAIVTAFRTRKERLEKSQAVLSRLIALRTSTQVNPTRISYSH